MRVALRARVDLVTIRPDVDYLGYALVQAKTDTTDQLIMLGGVAAEKIVLGTVIGGWGEGGTGDLDWFVKYSTPEVTAALTHLAEGLLRLHMPALWTLTAALLDRRSLSGSDVRKLVAGKLRPTTRSTS